jgi:hypothetical protein
MNALQRLQAWYAAQCNGDWEHQRGIQIESLDNPGWWIKIDLAGTALAGKPFKPVRYGLSDDKMTHNAIWYCCEVKEGRMFDAAGDPTQLEPLLNRFLDWAESHIG